MCHNHKVMAKIKSEDLRLNIIVNGDAGRKKINDLTKSMRDSKAAMDDIRRKQGELTKAGKGSGEEMKRLVSQYDAFKKTLDESTAEYARIQKAMSLTDKTMSELRSHVKGLRAALDQATPGTEQWRALNDELYETRKRLNFLSTGAEHTRGSLCKMADVAKNYIVSLAGIVSTIKSAYGKMEGARDSFLEYDEALVDAMKTTGLTREEIDRLSESLGGLDTRTARNELLSLVRAGGKLGITAEEDLLGFAKAADQINVALSEDLGGNAEAAITAIGKMTDIFGLKETYGIEMSMLKVGSAINELGMASTANEGYIVDFSKRLAGIAPNADISIDKVLGLAATLDKYGQQSETAATAIGQVIMAMFKRTETFAGIAGMELRDFAQLLKTDVNEALLRVLEGMRDGDGGLASVTAAMEEMHLNGQRAATVLGTLAKNTGELRTQQDLANKAFEEGTSLTEEFGAKNDSLTARLQKQKNELHDLYVEIGGRLNPVMSEGLGIYALGLKAMPTLVGFVVRHRAAIIALTAAVWAYNKAETVRTAFDKIRHFYSKQNRADLALEATMLAGSTRATMLHSAAMNLFAGNLKAAGIAVKALGKALLANPWGMVLAIIPLAIAGIGKLTKLISGQSAATKEAAKAHKELNDAYAGTKAKASEAKGEVTALGEAAKKAAIGSEERASAIRRINDEYGMYLPSLLTEASGNGEVAAAIALVNDQLERKIMLEGKSEAMASANERLQSDTLAARDSFARKFRQRRHRDMTAEESKALLDALVEYRDVATSGSATALEKGRARSRLIEGRLSSILSSGLNGRYNLSDDTWIQDVLGDLFGGIESYNSRQGEIDTLYGKGIPSLPPARGDVTVDDSFIASPAMSGKASKWSLSGDEEYLRAAYELKERYRTGDIASEEEYRKLLLDLEIDTLTKRIASERESGAESLALKSELADKQIDRQRLEGKEVAVDAAKIKEEQYKLERAAQETRNAEELAMANVTGKELEALKREQARKLADIDLEYLRELRDELERTIAGSGSPDAAKLDGSAADELKKKLQDVKKRIAEITAGLVDGLDSGGESGKPERRGGSLFGVGQDEWASLFKNIEAGKFGLDDLKSSVTALRGAFDEMFSLWSSASELQASNDRKRYKEFEKENDGRRKALDKRLDAGLVTEAQYNAEIERMDAEKDAYQEEMELRQARRQKTQKLTQSIINTALGVTKTLAEWGIPWGIAPAAAMGALGAAQTALIAAQPVTSGAEEGGFVSTRREQDGKLFKARLSPDKRGFVDSPTVLVGENGGEYVIPADGLANPSLRPLLATMESARRSGTLRSVNFEAIYPPSSIAARASGGFVGEPASVPGSFVASGRNERDDSRLVAALEALERRLGSPINAQVSMLGPKGIVEQTEKYNKYKQRGRL